MNEEVKNIEVLEDEDSSIYFGKIFQDLLKHKKLYYKVLPVAFLLAAIYAISLPNYYGCQVKLAPELGTAAMGGGGLASLASSFSSKIVSTTELMKPLFVKGSLLSATTTARSLSSGLMQRMIICSSSSITR